MHLHRLGVSLLAAGATVAPRILVAQTPDSALFHRGQWGAEFNVSGGFFGAGALRFTSPTHAWLVDVSADYQHSSTNGLGGTTLHNGTVTVKFGTRSYHLFGRRLYRLTTLGALFNYGRQSANPGNIFRSVGAGLFADLGASWFVAPHLGLGARWGATMSYIHGTASGGGTTTTGNSFTLSLGNVALTGQVTF